MFSVHSDPLAAIGSHDAGGQNVYTRNLMIHLDKLGWSVDVFNRLDDPQKKRIAKVGKHSRVIRLAVGKSSYIPKGQLHAYFPEFYEKFLKFNGYQNPYTLFHGHHYDGGYIGLLAQRQFHQPLVVNFHSLGAVRLKTHQSYDHNGHEHQMYQERLAMEKEIMQECSIIISLSKTEKRELEEIYGAPASKVTVIPGGVDIQAFSPMAKEKARSLLGLRPEDFIVLFVGRLEWRKGVGTLVGSTRLLEAEIPNLRVLVVGGRIFGSRKNRDDWNEYQRLLAKAQEKHIEDRVHFVGRIDQGRLPLYYSAADVLVVPSYYESFGLVALEGMAAKIPVVASRVGGLRATIADHANGLLFEPHNASDLQRKIREIYHSKKLAVSLVSRAYQDVVTRYSWSQIAKNISDLYDSFIHPDRSLSLFLTLNQKTL